MSGNHLLPFLFCHQLTPTPAHTLHLPAPPSISGIKTPVVLTARSLSHVSPGSAPLQAARELQQRRETPPQECRSLLTLTLVSHPYALLLLVHIDTLPHIPVPRGQKKRIQIWKEDHLRSSGVEGALVHPNRSGRGLQRCG